MNFQRPKGTFDLLPRDFSKRNFIYTQIRKTCGNYNYKEILTPVFEKTELFNRSIGETSDIVSKEMYSFNEDEYTLRPELTAPVIRAYLENSLFNVAPFTKLFYIANMFRRERPQAGRYREFWQFGVESIGSSDVYVDAEVILIANDILKKLKLSSLVTKVNNIGVPEERKEYISNLKMYLEKYKSDLSSESLNRLEKNPLRILDTKSEKEKVILKDAPVLYDYLRNETKSRFEKLNQILADLNIKFEIDHNLVRGFDYYTDTAFEIISGDLGSQNAVLGGGRYDRLIEQFGGTPTPAIGFAIGIERLLMLMDTAGFTPPEDHKLTLYVATSGDKAKKYSFALLKVLREGDMASETDYLSRSIKAQLKEANRINAKFVIVIGENEIRSGSVKIKRMIDGVETDIELNESKILNFLRQDENKTS